MLPLPSGICWGKPTPTHSVSVPKPIPFPPKIELIHLHAPRDARRGQGNHQLARGGGQDEDSVSNPHERDAFAAGQFRGPAPARRFSRRQDAIHSFCFSKPHPCIRNPPGHVRGQSQGFSKCDRASRGTSSDAKPDNPVRQRPSFGC